MNHLIPSLTAKEIDDKATEIGHHQEDPHNDPELHAASTGVGTGAGFAFTPAIFLVPLVLAEAAEWSPVVIPCQPEQCASRIDRRQSLERKD